MHIPYEKQMRCVVPELNDGSHDHYAVHPVTYRINEFTNFDKQNYNETTEHGIEKKNVQLVTLRCIPFFQLAVCLQSSLPLILTLSDPLATCFDLS